MSIDYQLISSFGFNIFIIILIVRGIYYPSSKRTDFLFTYTIASILVFFLCYTFQKYKIDLNLALGLFAIFSIIRYRTDPIPVKELSYLFLIMGISLLNSRGQIFSFEIIFMNSIFVIVTYFLENFWVRKQMISREVIYEKINLVKPELKQELLKDLRDRTGHEVKEVEIQKIDFLRDIAQLKVFY